MKNIFNHKTLLEDLRLNNERLFVYRKGQRKRYILIKNDNSIKIFKKYRHLKEYYIPF